CAFPGCEVEFTPRKGGRPQRYCSPEHQSGGAKRRYWDRNRERISAERREARIPHPERICAREGCDVAFAPVNRGDQKYCSEKCRDKVRRSTPEYKARAATAQRRREQRPERQQYIRAWRRRGLSDDEFFAMREAQQGRCAICGEQPDNLVLDHCHKSGG